MTHDKPFIRPCTADRGAVLVWGAREHELTPNEMLLWMGIMIEDMQSHNAVVVIPPQPSQEVRDE